MWRPAVRAAKGGWFLALGVILVSAGCGSSGPPRYPISGKVTYGGQPVLAGSVTLIPDTNQGNKGPATSVTIKDGQYGSIWYGARACRRSVRLSVLIAELDGKPSPEFPMGMLLFPEYELILDLPSEGRT